MYMLILVSTCSYSNNLMGNPCLIITLMNGGVTMPKDITMRSCLHVKQMYSLKETINFALVFLKMPPEVSTMTWGVSSHNPLDAVGWVLIKPGFTRKISIKEACLQLKSVQCSPES